MARGNWTRNARRLPLVWFSNVSLLPLPVRAAATTTFRSLRVRNFRLFWIGQMVSVSGTWMQTVAQNWLVLSLTGSGVALGVTVALQFLPMLLFGMWGGLVADRFDKRRILFVTQVVPMVLALVMFVLVATGAVALWMVYVLAFLLGLVFMVDMPTRQSFVIEMVGPDEVPNAVGLNSAMFNTGRVVGPAVAGVLIATVGTASTFLAQRRSPTWPCWSPWPPCGRPSCSPRRGPSGRRAPSGPACATCGRRPRCAPPSCWWPWSAPSGSTSSSCCPCWPATPSTAGRRSTAG